MPMTPDVAECPLMERECPGLIEVRTQMKALAELPDLVRTMVGTLGEIQGTLKSGVTFEMRLRQAEIDLSSSRQDREDMRREATKNAEVLAAQTVAAAAAVQKDVDAVKEGHKDLVKGMVSVAVAVLMMLVKMGFDALAK